MKVRYYEEIFEVTETCNNGNERRIKKSVLCNPFDLNGRHRTENERIQAATAELKNQHYYNIVYIETKTKYLTFA